MTNREKVVSLIWTRLVHRSKSPFPIMENEQELLTKEINILLDKGWTFGEITNYLCWTEYFNTEDSEDYCLNKLCEMNRFVEKRLSASV